MLERLGVQNEWRDKSKLAFAKLQRMLDPSFKFEFADPATAGTPSLRRRPRRPGSRTPARAGRRPRPRAGWPSAPGARGPAGSDRSRSARFLSELPRPRLCRARPGALARTRPGPNAA